MSHLLQFAPPPPPPPPVPNPVHFGTPSSATGSVDLAGVVLLIAFGLAMILLIALLLKQVSQFQ